VEAHGHYYAPYLHSRGSIVLHPDIISKKDFRDGTEREDCADAGHRLQGLPEIEMGIGLNEDEVIVGNIGSSKRSKYGVMGNGVNMTSRIESYSVGGQILISDSVRNKAGDILRIDEQRKVIPKGADAPLKIYEVGGIGTPYNLALEAKDPSLIALGRRGPLLYTALDGKDVGKDQLKGLVSRLSRKGAEIELEEPLELLTNIKMNLGDVPEELASKDFYGKVIECTGKDDQRYIVRFTSASPEVFAYFQLNRPPVRIVFFQRSGWI